MSLHLLATKLYIPHSPVPLVDRPRLFARLHAGLAQGARLILVCAPAGFGKSSLASAWSSTLAAPVAWLSLDAQDNDPLRFLTYLTAAIQRALPAFGADLLAQLRSGAAPSPDLAFSLLVNALEQTPSPLPVVLDDYHAISSPAIHAGMAFLLEHAPVGVTFILATRVAPPLPVARLRARRQLVDIRLHDLRFTAEEASDLLNGLNALALADQDIATLEARTEGWAAGLQLAALALQSEGSDRHRLVEQFGGSHEFIADYLVEEVLQRQPSAVTDFLVRTCILDRFCAGLAEAVTATVGGADLLGDLFARNLFLIPLDAERRWFRYHHLFADLLRARLKAAQPELIPELHRRASCWLEAEGLLGEALTHALAAGDTDAAARMVNQHWVAMIHQGQVGPVLRWLAALPAAAFAAYPGLSTAYAWALFLQGQMDEVEPRLAQAERLLAARQQAGDPAEIDLERLNLDAANQVLRVFLLYTRRDLEAAYAQAQLAMPASRLAGDLLEGNLKVITGNICRELGQLDQAVQYYRAGIPLVWQAGNVVGVLNAYASLSQIYRRQHQIQLAEQTCQEAMQLLRAQGLERVPALGLLYLEWATLLLEQQRLDEARALITTALEVVRVGGMSDLLAACEALRARLEAIPPELPPALARPQPDALDALTERELEVLALLADGCSNQEIAERLIVSLSTVKKHTSNILAKLEASSRTQAVAHARRQGLI
jgi:LuxR family transcriptional regulator, maltose regulon positive regulatory protein